MDRFRWCSYQQIDKNYNEKLIMQCSEVRIYENSERTSYEKGTLKLTNCRFIWVDERDPDGRSLSLPLMSVATSKVESPFGLFGTYKVAIKVFSNESIDLAMKALPTIPNWARNWLDISLSTSTKIQMNSPHDVIKFGFIQGVKYKELNEAVHEYIEKKEWNFVPKLDIGGGIEFRTRAGIADIERSRAARMNETDTSINKAFEDLDHLMRSTNTLVRISKELSAKIKSKDTSGEQEGSIEELRNELLTMGIMDDSGLVESVDAVTIDKHDPFHVRLAKEISNLILPIIIGKIKQNNNSAGGCIDMASVFCRINRARGLDLVSPKDVLRSCELLKKLNLPVVMKKFPSGLLVLNLATENEEETLLATKEIVENNGFINVGEFSRKLKIVPSLARERLNCAVSAGHLCLDESIEGRHFYPNRFLE